MNSKRRVIFLINSPFPRYAGGIETWLYNITKRIHAQYDVTIIAHQSTEYPVLFDDIPEDVEITHYKTIRSFGWGRKICRSYLVLLDTFLGSIMMSLCLRRSIINSKQAIVVALDSMFCVKAALPYKDSSKIISSVRGPHGEIYAKQYPLLSKFLIGFERRMLGKADKIWANGYDTIQDLRGGGFVSSLMKNGIDFNKIRYDIDSAMTTKSPKRYDLLTIASIGTLLPIKGVYELVEVVRILREKYKIKSRLILIGKGDQDPIKRFAIKNGVLECISFLGHKQYPWKEVIDADILACLSGGSGMSMAALESLATGIPVIGWDTTVYRQFNTPQQVISLVKEKDVIKLAERFVNMHTEYTKYLNMAQDAVALASTYDWEIVCAEFQKNIKGI